MDQATSNRLQAFMELLRPIEWSWGSSIPARQALVHGRHRLVMTAYPFMTDEEKKQADEWFVKEKHDGLWD